MPRVTAEQAIEAIHKSRGLLTMAAALLRCQRKTLYRMIEKYPTVAAAVDEECQKLGDLAEAQLYRPIQEGQSWAVCFYLKCRHKARGYVERPEPPRAQGIPFDFIQAFVLARENAIAKRRAAQQALTDGEVIDITPSPSAGDPEPPSPSPEP
jgi:hypothetical protein